jgi:hypothetical protein
LCFTFQVRDDGGTAIGGVDLDPTPNIMIINVTPVPDEIRVAVIGDDSGNRATYTVFSSGDLLGTATHLCGHVGEPSRTDGPGGVTINCSTASTFNAQTPGQLRAQFDVLLFTWVSQSQINADWTMRLLPYLQLGGGIIFEDPGNIADLAAVLTVNSINVGGEGANIATVSAVPGLTDGISTAFVNNHFTLTPVVGGLSPFLTQGDLDVVGLYGEFPATGGGRIVITGPDQHFHGFRGAGGAAGNQYNLLINEIRWVTREALEP